MRLIPDTAFIDKLMVSSWLFGCYDGFQDKSWRHLFHKSPLHLTCCWKTCSATTVTTIIEVGNRGSHVGPDCEPCRSRVWIYSDEVAHVYDEQSKYVGKQCSFPLWKQISASAQDSKGV